MRRPFKGRSSKREEQLMNIAASRFYAGACPDAAKRDKAVAALDAREAALPSLRQRIRRPVDGKPVVYEKDIQKAILQAIQLRPDVVFVGRFNRGQAVATDGYGNTRYTNFNTVKGFPDLHGLLRGGRAFYIEVKRPDGRTSPDQRLFLDKALGGGAYAGVATSVEEALQILPPPA